MVEVIRPPMTVMAMGWRKSLPVPRPIATGSMPRMSARVVIRMGRRRIGPATLSAWWMSIPRCRRILFVRSTSRIEFLVTRPKSRIRPIIAVMSRGNLKTSSASSPPTAASGSASMITKGWMNEPNCEASTI